MVSTLSKEWFPSYQVDLIAYLFFFEFFSSDMEVSFFFFRTKATLLFFRNKDNKFGVLKKKNCWCLTTIRFQASAKKKVPKNDLSFCLKLFWLTSKRNLFPPNQFFVVVGTTFWVRTKTITFLFEDCTNKSCSNSVFLESPNKVFKGRSKVAHAPLFF